MPYTEDESDSDGIKCWNSNWAAFYMDGLLNEKLSSICSETIPTSDPTESPTVFPSKSPTTNPTLTSTRSPTKDPTPTPTRSPSKIPTPVPSVSPTDRPSLKPSLVPSNRPSQMPTADSIDAPTDIPTRSPTENVTETPTMSPTDDPSEAPTVVLSDSPSQVLTLAPSPVSTIAPSNFTSQVPTVAPSNFTYSLAGNFTDLDLSEEIEIDEATTFDKFIDNVTWVCFATLLMLAFDVVVVALFCCFRRKCYEQKDRKEEVKKSTYPVIEEHRKTSTDHQRKSHSQSYSRSQSTSQYEAKGMGRSDYRNNTDGGHTFSRAQTSVSYGVQDELVRQGRYPSIGTYPTSERKYPATEMVLSGGAGGVPLSYEPK